MYLCEFIRNHVTHTPRLVLGTLPEGGHNKLLHVLLLQQGRNAHTRFHG